MTDRIPTTVQQLTMEFSPRTPRWSDAEILAFDLETTGVDRFGDVPVSFALVTMVRGQVTERTARVVDPGRDIPPEASAIHGITTERARREGVPLDDALEEIAAGLVDACRRGVPVAGMRLDYDLTIVHAQCAARTGTGLVERGWWGPVLDVAVIDRRLDKFRKGRRTLVDLCELYRVDLGQAHEASADAEASVRVLRALCAVYPEVAETRLAELHHAQAGWHHEWAASYSSWREMKGMPPLEHHELEWPVASPPQAVTSLAS